MLKVKVSLPSSCDEIHYMQDSCKNRTKLALLAKLVRKDVPRRDKFNLFFSVLYNTVNHTLRDNVFKLVQIVV